MKALVHHKGQAIALRKKGLSYNDILKQVPVARSSLSLWLKDLPLTKNEKLVLRDRLDKNISRGRIKAASVLRSNRLQREKDLLPIAQAEFEKYACDPLFQLGIGLYWAEGAKSSGGVMFTNSDIEMVEVMLKWFENFTTYTRNSLRYRLYIHKPYAHENCEQQWADGLQVPRSAFTPTSYKPTSKGIKIRANYIGCMRVEVPKSSKLLFTLKIWTNLLVEYHKKQ
jgi:hypothetical protein